MFETEEAYKLALEANPFLHTLNMLITWEAFREIIEKSYERSDYKGGRPSFDKIMMLKILLLQRIYNLSDEQMEHKGVCDISVKMFLGLGLVEKMPDEKTIWVFREHITQTGIVHKLFKAFDKQISTAGVKVSNGQIIDASFVEVPKQRNTREENKQIKAGICPQHFEEHTHKKSQKDMNARWSTRPKEHHFGYKNTIVMDEKQKIIRGYGVCSANVHDSQMTKEVIGSIETISRLHGDSAYRSTEISEFLREINCKNFIHQKATRNKALSSNEWAKNRNKSMVRAKVEHVFARIRGSMNRGLELRAIGITRIRSLVGLVNLTYNMIRLVSITMVKAK